MDVIALASRHVFMPLADRTHGFHIMRLRRELMRSQYLPEEETRKNQWRDLGDMLRYAYEHTRFYRARFDQEGITPGDIESFSDLARLPILTKDDIRNNLSSLVSDEFGERDLIRRRTGGSTGVPLRLYWDKRAQTFKVAISRRHVEWTGWRPGEGRAALWGNIKPATTLRTRVARALLTRTVFLDTLEMDDHTMLQFAARIRQARPRLLFGHGHSLYFFASFLKDRGVRDIKVKSVMSMAEVLSVEERRVVEEVFGTIVFDRYGCEEVGLVASECEAHDGMHVAAEGLYVEVLGAGEHDPGPVVVTDLVNRATPLIRYEIGDLATVKSGACGCGRGLPRFGKVVGRASDILWTPEGKRISGVSILDTMVIHIPGFKQVQIVQEKLDELTFNIVKDASCSSESLRMLSESVSKYFGPSMKHKVVFVDKILLTGRGKFQFSISKLKASDLPRSQMAVLDPWTE